MSRNKYFKAIFWLFATGILLLSVCSECALGEPKDETVDVGRGNPFAKIEMAKKAMPQIAFSTPAEGKRRNT